jgi:sugar lactone lactonase YvrE
VSPWDHAPLNDRREYDVSTLSRRAGRSSRAAFGTVTALLLLRLLLVGVPSYSAGNVITTVAGGGLRGFGGDGGPATAARLDEPRTMSFDPAGNMYIADTFNHVVRKVTPAGVITTVAGHYPGRTRVSEENCPSYLSGDGGPATSASLRCPHSVVVDTEGRLVIADSGNNRIRRVDAAGIITTIAGTGDTGFAGDGGPATRARLKDPKGIAIDRDGNLLIADSLNHRIRKVDRAGIITTVAGTGMPADSGDGGPAVLASLTRPRTVDVAPDGAILVAEPWANRIRRIDAAGIITTIAGTGAEGFSGDGGPATKATLNTPRGVTADSAGNVYIADSLNDRIRRVDPQGIITTIAGGSAHAFGGDGGQATLAFLAGPRAVAVHNGDLYVADTYNFRIRRISAVAAPPLPPAPAPPPVVAPPVTEPAPGAVVISDPGLATPPPPVEAPPAPPPVAAPPPIVEYPSPTYDGVPLPQY